LANIHHTSWNPNLIYFSNTAVFKTVNYYVQQLFASNEGDRYYAGVITTGVKDTAVASSCVQDSRTGDIILKVVHAGPGDLQATVDLARFGKTAARAGRTVLTGAPEAKNTKEASDTVVPKEGYIGIRKKFLLDIPPYSLQVIRIAILK